MAQLFKNDARSMLASALGMADTSLVVGAGLGDRFPVATMGTGTSGDWFKVTLEDETGAKEIVKVRTRALGVDVLSNIQRAQEGTTALDFDAGTTVVGLRLTAGDIQSTLEADWAAIPEEDIVPSGSNKTLTIACRGQHVDTDDSSITVPFSVFSKGDLVVIYNNSAADRSIIGAGGTTIYWDGGATGTRTLEPFGICTLFCVSTGTFRISGAGLS